MYRFKEIRISFKAMSVSYNKVIFSGSYNEGSMAYIMVGNSWNCVLVILDVHELKVIKEIQFNSAELEMKDAHLCFIEEGKLNILRRLNHDMSIAQQSIIEIRCRCSDELRKILFIKNDHVDKRKIVYALTQLNQQWVISRLLVVADDHECTHLNDIKFPHKIYDLIKSWRGLYVYDCLYIVFFISHKC